MGERHISVTVLFGWSHAATLTVLANLEAGSAEPLEVLTGPGHLGWRSMGCDCCAVRLDLHRRLRRTVRRSTQKRRIAVVGDASSPFCPTMATLLCDRALWRHSSIDASVVAVDGPEAAVRLASGWPLAPHPEAVDQMSGADLVMITGADALTAEARVAVSTAVARRSIAPAVWTGPGRVITWPGLPRAGYGLEAVAAQLDLLLPAPLEPGTERNTGRTGDAITLELKGQARPEALEMWMEAFVRSRGRDLVRLKVTCPTTVHHGRWAGSAVRSFYSTGLVGPGPEPEPGLKLLAVGPGLQRAEVVETLAIVLDADRSG